MSRVPYFDVETATGKRVRRMPLTAEALAGLKPAFEAMAVPFRDVEDAVGAAGFAGAARFDNWHNFSL